MSESRNIARFSYHFASFQGWRLTLSRRKQQFNHYFSDRKYGGKAAALQAAETVRERLLTLLKEYGGDPVPAFHACRGELVPNSYPQGLRPRKVRSEVVRKARGKTRRKAAEKAEHAETDA